MAMHPWSAARGWGGPAAAVVVILGLTADGRTEQAPNTIEQATSAREIAVAGTEIVVKLWDVREDGGAGTPHYAISLDGESFADPRAASYEIKLRHGRFDPLAGAGAPAVEEDFAAGADTNLHIVQFVTQPLEAYRQAIRDLGGTVHFFIPNHCHIVKMPPAVREAVEALPFVRWVGPYHPAYRLEPYVLQNMERAAEVFASQRYNIMVCAPGSAQLAQVGARLAELGAADVRADVSRIYVRATLTPAQVAQVVRWDDVVYVDRTLPAALLMDIARQIGGANFIENTLGFTGQGVRGEFMDGGFYADHGDFQSHTVLIHSIWPLQPEWHGTCVMGVLFGDGTGNPHARGLLPNGQPIWASFLPITLGLTNRFTHTAELVDPNGPYRAVFQSNSWGRFSPAEYTSISAEMDDLVFACDLVVVNGLGNFASQWGCQEAWAKNVVAVGGVVHRDTAGLSDDCWDCDLPTPPPGVMLTVAASYGPAGDGRIKPDLVHFYDRTFTTWDTCPTCYGEFLGTSNATPLASGHFGLLFQMWHERVFPGFGGAATVFDSRPHSTTARALMINTAYRYDWSQPGPNGDIDRFRQGWGMPNLFNLYEERNRMLIIDETEVLANFQTASFTVEVGPDERALRATLVYADPMSVPGAAVNRINDLSLKVTSPAGVFYWGNDGLVDGNVSTPGGEPNDLDVVENVFVEYPEPGLWAVEVLAREINEDSHLQTPEIDADFALVVSGLRMCPADVNHDLAVDVLDLLALLAAWGNPGGPEDVNGDGIVDALDLLELLAAWGPCPG